MSIGLHKGKIVVACKAVGTILGLGGKKQKKNSAKFFLITLFFQKDTIFIISISVISNIHLAINIF